MYDIIPDVHGQADKLKGALRELGYQERNGAWRHSDPARQVVFLGDFIDRGPDNREVIWIVGSMLDAGTALAVMGNHELNAIHFHTDVDGPLRPHDERNVEQHASFVREFPLGSNEAEEAITWMASLPLYLEFSGFRAVHAYWDEEKIHRLRQLTKDGVLTKKQLIRSANNGNPLFELVEIALKGPELELPNGFFFMDKGGHKRTSTRRKWWDSGADTWQKTAMSVPEPHLLPDETLPGDILRGAYPSDAPPVVFGHYWMEGAPVLQASNALCLDYSAGKDGPLVSYRAEPGSAVLSLGNLRRHGRH